MVGGMAWDRRCVLKYGKDQTRWPLSIANHNAEKQRVRRKLSATGAEGGMGRGGGGMLGTLVVENVHWWSDGCSIIA